MVSKHIGSAQITSAVMTTGHAIQAPQQDLLIQTLGGWGGGAKVVSFCFQIKENTPSLPQEQLSFCSILKRQFGKESAVLRKNTDRGVGVQGAKKAGTWDSVAS